MGVKVAVVQVVAAVAPAVYAEVGVGAKHAERAEREVEQEHVVGQRELVEAQVVVVAGAKVQHVARQLQAGEGVVKREVRAVAGVANVVGSSPLFFLNVKDFVVEAAGLAGVAFLGAGGMALGVNAGVQVKVNGVGVTTDEQAAIESGPNRVVQDFAAAVVHAEYRGRRDGKGVARNGIG